MVRPQVCSLFLLKALELGIFLGLPIESPGYTFCFLAIIRGLFVIIIIICSLEENVSM